MKKRLRSSISKSYKANNSTHIRLPIARQRQRPSTIDCVKTILFRQFILFKKMQKKKQLIENVNTVTRRERRRFIGEHLSFIKTTQINVQFLSGHYTQEISYRERYTRVTFFQFVIAIVHNSSASMVTLFSAPTSGKY